MSFGGWLVLFIIMAPFHCRIRDLRDKIQTAVTVFLIHAIRAADDHIHKASPFQYDTKETMLFFHFLTVICI